VLERMQRRVHQQPDKMRKRKQLVEHPFGTMKRWMEQGYFLMRRQEKVATEMSLTVLAYNLKRVLNLIGTRKMIAALA
jgi:transposase